MENDNYKEVYFNEFCKTCEHSGCQEHEDPCYECLNEPVNLYSHKPVKYKEKGLILNEYPRIR